MNWKLVGLGFVTLVVAALLITTEQGRSYAKFFTSKIGHFLSSTLNLFPTTPFEIEAKVTGVVDTKEINIDGSTVFLEGMTNSIRVDGREWEISDGRCELEMKGSGKIVLRGGKVSVDFSAEEVKFLGTRTKNAKIAGELIPLTVNISDGSVEMINITSATGSVVKDVEGTEITAEFENKNLEMTNFAGSLELYGGMLTLKGTVNMVKIGGREI